MTKDLGIRDDREQGWRSPDYDLKNNDKNLEYFCCFDMEKTQRLSVLNYMNLILEDWEISVMMLSLG